MKNTPDKVMILLEQKEAELLLEDMELAVQQILTLMNDPEIREEFIKKVAPILEMKTAVMKACREGLKE